jgi:hypothetical protein
MAFDARQSGKPIEPAQGAVDLRQHVQRGEARRPNAFFLGQLRSHSPYVRRRAVCDRELT